MSVDVLCNIRVLRLCFKEDDEVEDVQFTGSRGALGTKVGSGTGVNHLAGLFDAEGPPEGRGGVGLRDNDLISSDKGRAGALFCDDDA